MAVTLITRHRPIIRGGRDNYSDPPHQALFENLTRGLASEGVRYHLNPSLLGAPRSPSLVVGSRSGAIQASMLKRLHLTGKVAFGPNVMLAPGSSLFWRIAYRPDFFLVPSQWVKDCWSTQAPKISDRIVVWPVGVDEEIWNPGEKAKDQVLIYLKGRGSFSFELQNFVLRIQSLGLSVRTMCYGTYSPQDYLQNLQKSLFMLVIGITESQGLFLSEAWSCDVPTLILRRSVYSQRGIEYPASSAPYLDKSTGSFFDDTDDLLSQIEYFLDFPHSPRNKILEELSDSVCTKKLLEILGEK